MREYMPVARLWSIVEAAAAAVLMFIPAINKEQTAAILAVFALMTGEKVVRKVRAS